jgi:hypothetical protein
MLRLAKRVRKLSSSSLALSSLEDSYLVEDFDLTFFFLPSFAIRHLWPMLGKRRPLGDGDVGGVLVVGGVARAFVGVPLPTNMGIATLLLVVPFFSFLLPFLSSPLSLSLEIGHLAIK